MTFREGLIALLAALPVVAGAQQPSDTDTIVVTATRSEIPLREAIVPVTVISREQIELSLAADLAELLRFEAGLEIGRSGGPGQSTSIFIRGTESNHTLVLVDGVRINPGTIGGAALQNINPEIIERVEIIKGARSALYGTEAIGGVINIITRRVAAPYVNAGAGAGSFSQQTAHLSTGTRADWGEIGVTANWEETDGYDIRTDSDLDRGYENLSASVFGTRRFSSGEVTLRHWRAGGRVEYLDFFLSPLDQDYLNQTTAVELKNTIGERGTSKLIVSHSQDRIEQNQSADSVESDRFAVDWQYTVGLEEHTLTGGLFLADEAADSLLFGSGFDESTKYRAVFVQDSFSRGAHRAFLAARYTDYESFGSEVTWNAEYAFEINDRWRLSAGAGRAFRAPDATDLYGFGGNVDLDPESSDQLQLGFEFRATDRQTLRLELYRNDIDDLIDFDLASFTLQNIAEAEIRGAQLGYELDAETFTLRADAVYQSADNAGDNTRLLRRAEESLTVSYIQRLGAHSVGLSLLASGDRADFGTTLPSYTLLNLTGQFQIGDRWQLNARIENLLDEDYETAAGYRMQELSAYAELSYRYR